jgi:hypothetical protein
MPVGVISPCSIGWDVLVGLMEDVTVSVDVPGGAGMQPDRDKIINNCKKKVKLFFFIFYLRLWMRMQHESD